MTQEPPEQVTVECAKCGDNVYTYWAANGGGLLPGDYVLVADWFFHPECWDAIVNKKEYHEVAYVRGLEAENKKLTEALWKIIKDFEGNGNHYEACQTASKALNKTMSKEKEN